MKLASLRWLGGLWSAGCIGLLMASCGPTTETAVPESGDTVTHTGDTGAVVVFPTLSAAGTENGVALWTDSSMTWDQRIERHDAASGQWRAFAAGDEKTNTWIDTAPDGFDYYRIWDTVEHVASDVVSVTSVSLSVASDVAGGLRYNGERFSVSGAYDGDLSAPLAFVLSRSVGTLPQFLSGTCIESGKSSNDCWEDDPVEVGALAETLELELEVQRDSHGFAGYRLTVGRVHEDKVETVAYEAFEHFTIARQVKWGDLHAHTNLSQDGCEMTDENCADWGEQPGALFFETAVEAGLDFAAVTDHAEWVTLFPDGDTSGKGIDIWSAQNALVTEVESESFVPIVGYEWTWKKTRVLDKNGNFSGGHKTVVFEDTDICEAWRIAIPKSYEESVKGVDGAVAVTGNSYTAANFRGLWNAFGEARDACGTSGVMTFSHHSAYDLPQATDWANPDNAPDAAFETLVEMYSEHGSSECWDTSVEHCDWGLKASSDYVGEGSVQAALYQGYTLGFVGGTDSHDGRPGTTSDYSCVAHFRDIDGDQIGDEPTCHDYGGGLTGALIEGEFSRSSLFDAFGDRHTIVSSGPMIPVRAIGQGGDGRYYLPGSSVDIDTGMFSLWVSTDGLLAPNGFTLEALEVLDSTGAIVQSTGDSSLELELDLADDPAFYVRLRFTADDVEYRLWISPWFGR